MKKLLRIFTVLAFCLLLVPFMAACGNSSAGDDASVSDSVSAVNVAGLKGPTTLGMLGLMSESDKGDAEQNYNFTIAATADSVAPLLAKGELDIVAVPSNLASVLYHNTNGGIKVIAVNTLGVLYIVTKNEEVNSIADLKGKTLYVTGKGTSPEYNLCYLLEANGIDPEKDVNLSWKSEATEIVAALNEDESAVAMLPQPYVMVAKGSVEGLEIALNLNEEWQSLDTANEMVTGVIVANSSFIQENPDAVDTFLEEYAQSVEFVNANPDEAGQLADDYDIFKAEVAAKAIPFCNIVCLTGNDMKTALAGYLEILLDSNPQSVGGSLPGDDFYYRAD